MNKQRTLVRIINTIQDFIDPSIDNIDKVDEETITEKINNLKKYTIQDSMIETALINIECLYASAYYADHLNEGILTATYNWVSEFIHNPLYFYPIADSYASIASLLSIGVIVFNMYNYQLKKARIEHKINNGASFADPKKFTKTFALPFEEDEHSGFNNYIFSKNLYIAKNAKHSVIRGIAKAIKKDRLGPSNMNTLIMGGPGTGKTRYYLKPNLLQMNCSYVITDPSGDLFKEMAETLYRLGYDVKVLDIGNMTNCNQYNPLKYCKNEKSIGTFIESYISNTKKEGESSGSKDPFWDNAMTLYLMATISLLMNFGDDPEIMDGKKYVYCLSNLCELTRMAAKGLDPIYDKGGEKEDTAYLDWCKASANEKKPTALGHLFYNVRRKFKDKDDPFCLMQWDAFKLSPEKTMLTILTTAAVSLSKFDIEEVRNLTSDDSMDLDNFGNKRTVIFIRTPTDQDGKPYRFLASLLFTQLFSSIQHRGENEILGSYSLKLQNNEHVKWFPKTMPLKDIEKEVEELKDASIIELHAKLNEERSNADEVYYAIVDNKFDQSVLKDDSKKDEYEIFKYIEDHTISRRPTRELAEQYLKDLKNAVIRKHDGKDIPGTEMPTTCRFMIDEFANIGEIPNFRETLGIVRKYNITCDVIIQSITQLKRIYGNDSWSEIDGNSALFVFLGSKELEACKYISEGLGNRNIIRPSINIDGKKVSGGRNITQEPLRSVDQLMKKAPNKLIVMISQYNPVEDEKYELKQHPNYIYTQEYMRSIGKDGYYIYDLNRFPKMKIRKLIYEVKSHDYSPHPIDISEKSMEMLYGENGTALQSVIKRGAIEGALHVPGDLGIDTIGVNITD